MGSEAAGTGTVGERRPSEGYRLVVEKQEEVTAHAAGVEVKNFVRLRAGDRVEVELSTHERGRGRITKVLRKL